MRIGILGPLTVWDGDGRPIEVGGPRVRALLIRLAMDAGRTVPADRLVEDLWAGEPPANAANALQALVSRLRRVVEVTSEPGGYRLSAEVDAADFERLAREHRPAEALALWRGPALAEVADAEFALAYVTRLDELRLTAVEERVEDDLRRGEGRRLLPELERLTAEHPLRERLRGQLMRALYAAGRQADALDQYEDTRQALADRLGVDPSPELAAVHLAILRQDAPPRTNLSAQLTSFVGRERELERLVGLLGDQRLVTLTGPGGAGKTRLAIEASGRFVGRLPDGVWFVPLAPVRDALDVPQAVLTVVGFTEVIRPLEPIPAMERLLDVLAGRELLLILDNCEHLVDAVARLTDRLLAAAPGVRVLATSREPLGITGETLAPVPSLPTPPADADAATAISYSAVRLFTDRAAAVRPGFTVDAGTVRPVVQICRALDGIPLAIELAAARLRALTARQIADRLDDRFRLLNGGSRTALPRHQTLRAIVDWSWDLLDETERSVLRRLSVFNGGATPDTAEAILGDVIDVIASLVDKSLVMVRGDAEVRYHLLETVRVYAAEKLAQAGEEAEVRDAHAAYFLELAETAEPELRRTDQMRWSDRLNSERDNCNAALRHVIDSRDVPSALRMVSALLWFWLMRDYESEAGHWALETREIAGDRPPPGLAEPYALVVLMALMVTEIARERGPSLDRLREGLAEVIALVPDSPRHPMLVLGRPLALLFANDIDGARAGLWPLVEHDDPWIRAGAQVALGLLAASMGELKESGELMAAGYQGFADVGDRFGKIVTLGGMTELATRRGAPAEAVRLAEEAYGYADDGISPDQGAVLLVGLGRARIEAGDVERGRQDLERGIRYAERIGERSDASTGYVWLSRYDRQAGNLDEADRHAQAAFQIADPNADRADFGSSATRVYIELGFLAEQRGDLDAAAAWHDKAMAGADRYSPVPITNLLVEAIEGQAALAAARGDHTRAATLLGLVDALRGEGESFGYDYRRTAETAVAALGRDAFDVAFAEGREITPELAREVRSH